MKCKVQGCDRECTHYPGKGICQKHYFRMMRYGTYELTKQGKRKDRTQNTKGYQMIRHPDHPLVMANGFVYEHRKVIYDRYGDILPPCEKCGKEVTWKTVHIDHIDEVVDNNTESNLRVLCRACNVMRSRVHIAEHTKKGRLAITFNGETKTATEWTRDPRVSISVTAIRHRLKNGMSVEDALFSPKVTHRHTKPKTRTPQYGEYRGAKRQESA
ncbi:MULTISPECIES: HNH endonuclease signature motif containing protein [Klebsiella]|uniref:HNH endonuclease signature motif containing protein n=1 Tax=Klebsiella TaxID=570 RepID=UPI0005C36DC4|nr:MULTISPECIES: HNH endonuclease signature motif containing protein [Klebsiella]MBZ6551247.1 HNH endonuclease [Klebsiella michiganensis]MBZ7369025.1 HNH endonuclease [Klebsiella michiganensis]MCE7547235.1 HNH endonuclease [Klebsiella michiganensis]